ncbi:MAG: class C sortase [Clostridia bacterium]
MKKNYTKILFAIGFLIFIFPFVIRLISYFNQTTVVYNYKSDFEKLTESEKEQRRTESEEYNNKIADEKPVITMADEEFEEEPISTFDFLKTGTVIGTLTIPSLDVNLPIYDGLEDNNLQKGVVHLDDTSYPTGQASTHCVLAGHSGLTRAKILDDADKLQIGDNFQVEYLNETNNYEIIDIKIVLPYETESLQIIDNETLVTLVTCTPKGINTHRLLITGKKVPMPQQELTKKEKIIKYIKEHIILVVLSLVAILLITILILILTIKNKKKKVLSKIKE